MKREVTMTWKPKTKDRPRSGRGHTYTPKATADAEENLRAQWEAAADKRGWEPLVGNVRMTVTFTNGRVKVGLESLEREITTKGMTGDLDNYLKLISDALNGVAYEDDRQIVELQVVKK